MHLGHRTFRRLHEIDGVRRVCLSLLEAADLGAQLLGDRQACGVVGSIVDPIAGRQPLHRLREVGLSSGQLSVSVERFDVGLNTKGHTFPP